MRRFRRAAAEIFALKNIDAYAAVGVAVALAVLTLVDIAAPKAQWAVVLAALAILLFRSVVPPERRDTFNEVADDRAGFDRRPLSERWANVREVCVFAPSAVNLLTPQNCDLLRRGVLARPDGMVRIVVLDPNAHDTIAATQHVLDEQVDFPMQKMTSSLDATMVQLQTMIGWQVAGTLEVRTVAVNPGFSLVLTDPARGTGSVIVEFHGFHNETTGARMHLDLNRDVSERWFTYWSDQFEHLWRTGSPQFESVVGWNRRTTISS